MHLQNIFTESTILVIIFWNFAMFQYRSDSPQAKRNLIFSIANLLYELPHELPNDLRLIGTYDFRKYQKNLKFGWKHSLVPSFLSRIQTLSIAVKNTQKHIPNFSFLVQFYRITPFCSKYLVRDCLSKQNFGPNPAQFFSNSNFLTYFITSKHFYDS